MTEPAPKRNSSGRRTWSRRTVYGIVAAVALALFLVDSTLKKSDQAGFRAPTATWQLEAADLPALYSRWLDLSAYDAFREHAPGTLQSLAVSLRKITGVRPTPGRLRFWLGGRALLAGSEGGWCLSVRPGLAFRAATLAAAPPFGKRLEEPPSWQPYASAWRDGFFLVASSQSYLDTILTEGEAIPASSLAKDTLACSWKGPQSGTFELRVQEGLPLSLTLSGVTAPDAPAALAPENWDGAAGWASFDSGHLATIAADTTTALTRLDAFSPAWKQLAPVAAAWWEAYCPLPISIPDDEPWCAGIFETDFREDIPVIEMVMAKAGRGSSFLPGEMLQSAPIHRWNDVEGRLIPLPGSAREWATASTERVTYLTSGEHLMPAALGGALAPSPGMVAVCEGRWEPLAGALSDLVQRAAKEELLPGLSRDEVSRDVVPVFDALSNWGILRVHVVAETGAMRGEGYLAQAPEPS